MSENQEKTTPSVSTEISDQDLEGVNGGANNVNVGSGQSLNIGGNSNANIGKLTGEAGSTITFG